MKLKLYFLIFLFGIIGCSQEPTIAFNQLIDEHFLQFIDTTAYKSGRFVQIPNDTTSTIHFEKLCVSVDPIISRSEKLKSDVLTLVYEKNLKEFEELIINNNNLPIDTLDLSQIKSKGRYSLIQSGKQIDLACSILAGYIKFYTPFLSSNKAMLIFSVFDSPKSGFTQCWLFKKDKGHWQTIYKFELERW